MEHCHCPHNRQRLSFHPLSRVAHVWPVLCFVICRVNANEDEEEKKEDQDAENENENDDEKVDADYEDEEGDDGEEADEKPTDRAADHPADESDSLSDTNGWATRCRLHGEYLPIISRRSIDPSPVTIISQ